MVSVVIDYTKCKTNMQCLESCPVGVFEKQGDRVVVAHEDKCTVCRVCESVCPCGAVTVTE